MSKQSDRRLMDEKPVDFKPQPIKDRVTVVLRLHHLYEQQHLESFNDSFDDSLEFSVEPYSRRKKVGEEKQPLDLGWVDVDKAGYVVIQNNEGRLGKVQIQPDDATKKAIAGRVVEICFEGSEAVLEVHPGRSLPIHVNDYSLVTIRCRKGEAEYRIIVIPR